MLKKLFSGLTDFTEAILKIAQISKPFSVMLVSYGIFKIPVRGGGGRQEGALP